MSSELTYTLPPSVVEVIEQTGSPSAGLRKLKQISGLVPVRHLVEVTLGDVRKREQLGQFCAVFAPQIEAAKQTFAASQSTTKPAKPGKEAKRMSEAAYIRSLEQRIEALEAGLGAAPAARKPKARPSQGKLQVAVAKSEKAKAKAGKPNTFGPKVVAKFELPTRKNATFVWPSTGTTFVVVGKTKDGGIEARKAA